jgi:hypothetical protein
VKQTTESTCSWETRISRSSGWKGFTKIATELLIKYLAVRCRAVVAWTLDLFSRSAALNLDRQKL